MKRIALVGLLLLGTACSESDSRSSDSASEATNEVSPSPVETPEPDVVPALVSVDEELLISADANIFAAGRKRPLVLYAGGGTLAPGWRLPAASRRVVTFPSVAGRVSGYVQAEIWNGPAGTKEYDTDIKSFGGISGIVHRQRAHFLVGVFLTNELPKKPTPARLNVTDQPQGDLIAPRIGQVFLIGDGKGLRCNVPPEATRLFVGFADAVFWSGTPAVYGNNSGSLKATIALTKG